MRTTAIDCEAHLFYLPAVVTSRIDDKEGLVSEKVVLFLKKQKKQKKQMCLFISEGKV